MWIEFNKTILNLDKVVLFSIHDHPIETGIKAMLTNGGCIKEIHLDISFSEQRLLQLKSLLVNK